RRIAYIGGPPNNAEAQLRFQAYQEALTSNQIPYNPDYVFHGNFWGDAGRQAVNVFLEERKIIPEAIVAANDLMAIYSIKELQSKGYRIPEDITVTGFDDILDAKNLKPSLTTISQPFVSFGETAITTIAALINGESLPNNTVYLEPNLIVRHSCGCRMTHSNIIELNTDQTQNQDWVFLNKTINALEENIPEITEMLNLDPSLKWAQEFINAFDHSLKNNTNDFELKLHKYVNQGLQNDLSATAWFKAINLLEENYINYPNYEQYQKQIYGLTRKAYQIIGPLSDEFQNSRYNLIKTQFDIIHRIYWAINSRYDYESLQTDTQKSIAEDLSGVFQQMKINSFFLALYDENNPNLAKLNSFYNNSDNVKITNTNEPFLAQNLIPGELYQEEPGF
ncbi:MAG TPA: substrate-binding domain-containing protein, partial [Bacillota bacterium]|nr:substrate-binding domain-containing protein [Bacillota bacterium]